MIPKYEETEQQKATRLNNFCYHKPTDTQLGRYEFIRENVGALAMAMNNLCPPSRELSLAMTKLEEAVMWANAAIARNEDENGNPKERGFVSSKPA